MGLRLTRFLVQFRVNLLAYTERRKGLAVFFIVLFPCFQFAFSIRFLIRFLLGGLWPAAFLSIMVVGKPIDFVTLA